MLIAVTSFRAKNTVFNITSENNSFSFTIPGHWSSRGVVATNIKLRELLAHRELNDIRLHVEEVKERGNDRKTRDMECNLSDLDTRRNETFKELKIIERNDLDAMVYRMDLTYSEIEILLDIKYISTSFTG